MGFCDAQEYGGDESAMGDYAERNVLATIFFSCAWVERNTRSNTPVWWEVGGVGMWG